MWQAGFQALELRDPVQEVTLPLAVFYPALGLERVVRFGPYPVEVVRDAPVAAGRWPLLLISHGNGGSPFVHRGLAADLARHGAVVALPEHLGNSRSDNSLEHTAENLVNRPRHLVLCIGGLSSGAEFSGVVDTGRIALIGHSIGAYAALAVAGGVPSAVPGGTEFEVSRDRRVGAVALLAPAVPWFQAPGALRGVRVPVFLRTGERDRITDGFHARIVLDGLPSDVSVDYQVVENAGHFSFQSPFPPAMVRPGFAPAGDPPGFDRAAYEPVLAAELRAFLARAFGGGSGEDLDPERQGQG